LVFFGNEAIAGNHLSSILNKGTEIKKSKQVPVVVFDLDSTLFNNGPRSKAIMMEFSAKLHPKLLTKVSKLDEQNMAYRLDHNWKKIGIKDPKLINQYKPFWVHRFFNDQYVPYDTVYPGAQDLVKTLYSKGFYIVYLTGRDSPRMLQGTVRSLQQYGFPIGEINSTLIMKPNPKMDDTVFKKSVIDFLKNLGTVVATFENEPKNANLFFNSFPKSKHFFLKTNSAHPEVPLKKKIIAIRHFQEM